MNSFLAALYLSIRNLVDPLSRKFGSLEALEYLLERYGWGIALEQGAFEKIGQALEFKAPLEQFLAVAGSMQTQLESDPDADVDPQAIGELIEAADALFGALATLTSPSLDDLAAPLNDRAFWESIADHLLDDLLEEYLRLYRPQVFLVLHAAGVIRYDASAPEGPFRTPYTRIVFDWDHLSRLLREPVDALGDVYGWSDDPNVPLQYQRLFDVLQAVARAIHLPARTFAPNARLAGRRIPEQADFRLHGDADGVNLTFLDEFSPLHQVVFELGLEIFAATKPDSTIAKGLVLSPVIRGGVAGDLPLGGELSLRWKSAADASGAIGAVLFPDKVDLLQGQAAIEASVELVRTSTEPLLFGSARGPRAELRNLSAGFSIKGTLGAPEIQLHAGAPELDGKPGCRVVVPLGDADGFVQETTRTPGLEFSFSPEVLWSNTDGLAFNGKPTIAVNIPLGVALGPVTLTEATVSLAPVTQSEPAAGSGGWALRVGISLIGHLGPVTFVVESIGVTLTATPKTRADVVERPAGTHAPALGVLDLGLRFAPPKGLGLAVDAAGVLTGGGYLFFDEAQHTYGGVVQLSVHEAFGVKAFGLVTTRMPDGRKGYSLVVFITVEDFTPIQLGFGFALVGIGGMLGIHRTFDEVALSDGLRAGTVGALLFPKDPIANAPAIIRALGSAFPVREGSYLFGVLAKVAWFTPPLVLFELGLIFEFGGRFRLLVLGRVSALLPSRDNDLVRLNLDSIGVLDFDQGTATIDAVLVDSRLAHKFPLTGAMALRARWGSGPGPVFVLAVGGLNPRFAPPAKLPVLERMAIALSAGENPRLICESYFAITSNTLQFGARAQVYASAHGFSVEGDIGFDVLVEFRPFHFIAEFHASVQLKRGTRRLFKVQLAGQLEGPRPLRVSGEASFEILCCDLSVRFDKTLIEGEKPPLPPAVDALAELRRALETPGNWSTRRPANRQPGVTLSTMVPAARVVVDPLGSLVVKQQVVPLNTARDVDLFGGAPVAGDRRFRITATLDGHGRTVSPVRDQFAPSQFYEMNADEKLSSPSFEEMDAGVLFGGDALDLNDAQIVPAPVKYKSFVIDDGDDAGAAEEYVLESARLQEQSRTGSVATAAIRTVGLARFRDDTKAPAAIVRETRWTIRPLTGELETPTDPLPVGTWSEARAALKAVERTGVRWQVVPVHEIAS